MSSAMKSFFQEFERNSNLCDPDVLVSQFAETFLVASPQGARVVPAHAFALALPERKKRFTEMGCGPANLISLRETTLGTHYVMAETEWRMRFAPEGKSPEDIMACSTFIVYTGEQQPKIVFYLPQHDVMALLKGRTSLDTEPRTNDGFEIG
jgi:hypothetical protein